ncbi:transcriptional repressor LexA [Numidum massiliense]|uniref:transcriptional repressor LexA n=1 Tax=Numidum massiliense TaxID=1522315 RepID=UPI0006D57104|nr:transcriptional repressor LexA [Numidum massiliense]
MTNLTPRQQAILDFIREQVREKGYPPSVREIGEAVGLASSSTVHGHLSRLEKKGVLRRDPTKPRAIELLDEDSAADFDLRVTRVPLLGKVTAGEPITAVENVEDYYYLPRRMVGDGDNAFLLRVQGESMINIGICDGDYVVVRQQHDAINGDVVVAMTDEDEVTVKRFYKEKNRIRLQPENDAMEPIFLSNVTILGKVTGLFRTIH